MPPEVAVSIDARVALVELRRPPHNFLDPGFVRELADGLEQAATSARAIVVAAEGRSFCAGANFSAGGEVSAGGFREMASRFYESARRIFALPVPLVAAVHGPAVGAGVGLAIACDLRVTCPEAHFAANFTRLGIHPGFAVTETLPALIGPARAADLLLTGRRVHGEEAYRIGLADRCVPHAEVREAATALAAEIAAAAPLAVAATRATLRRGLAERVNRQLDHELEQQAILAATEDAVEGISAVLAKREPDFKGR